MQVCLEVLQRIQYQFRFLRGTTVTRRHSLLGARISCFFFLPCVASHKVDDLVVVGADNALLRQLAADVLRHYRTEAQQLNGYKGSHCHHSHNAESVGKNFSSPCITQQAPMAKGSMKVVVSGPEATPPLSKAIAVYTLGTKKLSPSDSRYPGMT